MNVGFFIFVVVFVSAPFGYAQSGIDTQIESQVLVADSRRAKVNRSHKAEEGVSNKSRGGKASRRQATQKKSSTNNIEKDDIAYSYTKSSGGKMSRKRRSAD